MLCVKQINNDRQTTDKTNERKQKRKTKPQILQKRNNKNKNEAKSKNKQTAVMRALRSYVILFYGKVLLREIRAFWSILVWLERFRGNGHKAVYVVRESRQIKNKQGNLVLSTELIT